MRRVIPLLALALVMAACGDDDTGGEGTTTTGGDGAELVAALRTQISEDSGSGGFVVNDEQAGCFAVGLIDEFGAGTMADAIGGEFSDFMGSISSAERRTVIDIMFGCVDLAEGLAAELGADGAISLDSARCISEAMLASDDFRDVLAESFVDAGGAFENPALVETLLPAMFSCLTPEELAQIGAGG